MAINANRALALICHAVNECSKNSRLLITGGGALNDFFVNTLQEKLKSDCTVIVPPKKFIEYKEAMVFGFMGVLKSLGETNIYASVTGAKENSSSGVIFEPNS